MPIRRLPDVVVNRIAAGEVVERPASAVKELVENALDAGAGRITIDIRDGGCSALTVTDDGCGMDQDDLVLAVDRHATSKLPIDDLLAIATFGFRGEALPSIGAVSRLRLTSRAAGADAAWSIEVEGGRKGELRPAALSRGTCAEVRDLFFATPARLKFLKAPATEAAHVVRVVERLAMAHPGVAFTLTSGTRTVLQLPAATSDEEVGRREQRLRGVLGGEVLDNLVVIEGERDGVRLSGFASLPTLHRRSGGEQFLFVNSRPVSDRMLLGAVRGAYQGLIAADRHPVVILFLEVPVGEVDVNVHPMKTEVRFREPQLIRSLIIRTLREGLAATGRATATTVAAPLIASTAGNIAWRARQAMLPLRPRAGAMPSLSSASGLGEAPAPYLPEPASATVDENASGPLGMARAQLHGVFIISQTSDGIVIVDQHAAHERIVHQRLKAALAAGGVERQSLLIPEVVDLGEAAASRLLAQREALAALGLVVEPFGWGAVVVREIPAVLGQPDIKGLIRDLAEEAAEMEGTQALDDLISAACARMACHGSIRAGRQLSLAEMNELLRQMESTDYAGQCSHGRPTYVELKLADIERLFGRR